MSTRKKNYKQDSAFFVLDLSDFRSLFGTFHLELSKTIMSRIECKAPLSVGSVDNEWLWTASEHLIVLLVLIGGREA